jgi:hypothetical protein
VVRDGASIVLLVLAAGWLEVSGAAAQPPPPGAAPQTRPVYSPYLNLLRNDVPFYQNYYGLVRPEFEFRRNIRGLQQDVGALDQAASAAGRYEAADFPTTGHSAGFLTQARYFNTSRVGAALSAPRQTTAARPALPTTPTSPSGGQSGGGRR